MSVTKTLVDVLRRHYIKRADAPGGVFIPECGLNNGFSKQSRCDALYVGFTSTSGRLLVGHEIKVSRADWLHELAQPDKASVWADQCHVWWLVTPDPSIVQPGELPHGWGHMVPGGRGSRMKVITAAEVRSERVPSWLIMRSILARLDTLQQTQLRDAAVQHRQAVDAEARRLAEERHTLAASAADRRNKERSDLLAAVEDALQVKFTEGYDLVSESGVMVTPQRLRAALAFLNSVDSAAGGGYGALPSVVEQLNRHAAELEEAQAALTAILEQRSGEVRSE